MNRVVFLDSGPLWILVTRPGSVLVDECNDWLEGLVAGGITVVLPEIADYETRRELVRTRRYARLGLLDELKTRLHYLPLDTSTMLRAADLWALARQRGQPTAGDDSIDGDVILTAQAELFAPAAGVIATTNVGHLSRLYPAAHWSAVTP